MAGTRANALNISTDGVVSADLSAFTTSSVTQHDILVAGANQTITSVTPSTAGLVLTSNGTGSDPSFQSVFAGATVTSWTPALAFGGSSTGITYAQQHGSYYQLGNLFFFYMEIQLSSKGTATGVATISNFPVTSTERYALIQLYTQLLTYPTNYTQAWFLTNNALSGNNIRATGSNQNEVSLDDTNFSNNTQIVASGCILV